MKKNAFNGSIDEDGWEIKNITSSSEDIENIEIQELDWDDDSKEEENYLIQQDYKDEITNKIKIDVDTTNNINNNLQKDEYTDFILHKDVKKDKKAFDDIQNNTVKENLQDCNNLNKNINENESIKDKQQYEHENDYNTTKNSEINIKEYKDTNDSGQKHTTNEDIYVNTQTIIENEKDGKNIQEEYTLNDDVCDKKDNTEDDHDTNIDNKDLDNTINMFVQNEGNNSNIMIDEIESESYILESEKDARELVKDDCTKKINDDEQNYLETVQKTKKTHVIENDNEQNETTTGNTSCLMDDIIQKSEKEKQKKNDVENDMCKKQIEVASILEDFYCSSDETQNEFTIAASIDSSTAKQSFNIVDKDVKKENKIMDDCIVDDSTTYIGIENNVVQSDHNYEKDKISDTLIDKNNDNVKENIDNNSFEDLTHENTYINGKCTEVNDNNDLEDLTQENTYVESKNTSVSKADHINNDNHTTVTTKENKTDTNKVYSELVENHKAENELFISKIEDEIWSSESLEDDEMYKIIQNKNVSTSKINNPCNKEHKDTQDNQINDTQLKNNENSKNIEIRNTSVDAIDKNIKTMDISNIIHDTDNACMNINSKVCNSNENMEYKTNNTNIKYTSDNTVMDNKNNNTSLDVINEYAKEKCNILKPNATKSKRDGNNDKNTNKMSKILCYNSQIVHFYTTKQKRVDCKTKQENEVYKNRYDFYKIPILKFIENEKEKEIQNLLDMKDCDFIKLTTTKININLQQKVSNTKQAEISQSNNAVLIDDFFCNADYAIKNCIKANNWTYAFLFSLFDPIFTENIVLSFLEANFEEETIPFFLIKFNIFKIKYFKNIDKNWKKYILMVIQQQKSNKSRINSGDDTNDDKQKNRNFIDFVNKLLLLISKNSMIDALYSFIMLKRFFGYDLNAQIFINNKFCIEMLLSFDQKYERIKNLDQILFIYILNTNDTQMYDKYKSRMRNEYCKYFSVKEKGSSKRGWKFSGFRKVVDLGINKIIGIEDRKIVTEKVYENEEECIVKKEDIKTVVKSEETASKIEQKIDDNVNNVLESTERKIKFYSTKNKDIVKNDIFIDKAREIENNKITVNEKITNTEINKNLSINDEFSNKLQKNNGINDDKLPICDIVNKENSFYKQKQTQSFADFFTFNNEIMKNNNSIYNSETLNVIESCKDDIDFVNSKEKVQKDENNKEEKGSFFARFFGTKKKFLR